MRVKEPPASSPYKGNTDLLLIKHLSETHNRHYAAQHKHNRPKAAPQRPRNKRRPKPVYGPPPQEHQSSVIDNYDFKYTPNEDTSYNDHAPQREHAYHNEQNQQHNNQQQQYAETDEDTSSYNNYAHHQEKKQPQHNHQQQYVSFGEPPEESSSTSSVDYNRHQLEQPSPTPIHNLPIESNSNHYMLPPSTSYGVPVAPIINVYPDKLEYMHRNLPSAASESNAEAPTSANSLYNVLKKLQPTNTNNGAASYVPEDTASSNQPHLHFAEPLPDYYPGARETSHKPSSPSAGIQFHSVPDRPFNDPVSSSHLDDGQFDDINSDENDEFGPYSAQNFNNAFQIASSGNQRSSIHRPVPKNHRSDIKFNDQTVDRLLARYNNASYLGAVPKRSHTLDTDDLRSAFANDFSRFRIGAPSISKPKRFGQRIPKKREPETTPRTAEHRQEIKMDTEDAKPTTTQSPDATTASSTDASPILVLLSSKNNASDTSSASSAPSNAPIKRDTISSTLAAARRRKPHRQPVAHQSTPPNQYDQLNIRNLTKRLFDDLNVEILSIQPSKSHSFYAGTVTPTTIPRT